MGGVFVSWAWEYILVLARWLVSAYVHGHELDCQLNTAAVIQAYPLWSGVAEPSQPDELITTRLKDALSLVDIQILDHLLGGF
jgi:hypothetical protein